MPAVRREYLECVNCNESYDGKLRQPFVGSCGHTICRECLLEAASQICTNCKRPDAFDTPRKNFAAEDQFWRRACQIKQISGKCSECRQLSCKLRICLECNTRLLTSSGTEAKFHFLTDDLRHQIFFHSVCSDCLVDKVSRHAEHRTEPLFNVLVRTCGAVEEDEMCQDAVVSKAAKRSQGFDSPVNTKRSRPEIEVEVAEAEVEMSHLDVSVDGSPIRTRRIKEVDSSYSFDVGTSTQVVDVRPSAAQLIKTR